MADFFGKWSKVIKKIEFPKREPMQEQAIEFLVSEGAMEPTIRMELSTEEIDVIITNETDCSSYDLISECGKWIDAGDNTANYLSLYFFKTNEVWLAYLMAVFYAKMWDGKEWANIGPETSDE